jgi:hypothetical protein
MELSEKKVILEQMEIKDYMEIMVKRETKELQVENLKKGLRFSASYSGVH